MLEKLRKLNLANFAICFTMVVGMLMVIIFSHYLFADNVHLVEQEQ